MHCHSKPTHRSKRLAIFHHSLEVPEIVYLQVLHRIPVMFHKDDRVCTGEVQAKTADLSRQEKNIDRWIVVEPL